MPVTNIKRESVFIGIPQDMNKISWKVVITNLSNITCGGFDRGTFDSLKFDSVICENEEYDVTEYLSRGSISRLATGGLSNFNLELDNNGGRYKDIFSAGHVVDIYYGFTDKSSLSTIRFRGYIEAIADSFNLSDGCILSVEGRDAPKSSTNEHFADTHITFQSAGLKCLECWFGSEGNIDDEGNYSDGILYNSGLILKVYDTEDDTWKVWQDLSSIQKDTILIQTGYATTIYDTFVEKSRLTISRDIAVVGDFEFRIYYDDSQGKSYLMVHPEDAVLNTTEHVTTGQNLIELGRYGADTTEEYNRIKAKGATDGYLLSMRTKQDTARQSAVWIKDLEETKSALTTDDEISALASARLNELKTALKKGTLTCCALPTLQPGEKIPLTIPYIVRDNVKVKSFNIEFGNDLEFSLDLQDRETRFEKIFKDRIDENVNITPNDNPYGLTDALIFDFTDEDDYTLTHCKIQDGVLSLVSGQSTGTCTTTIHAADLNITFCQLRILANNYENCIYSVSNGSSVKTITPGGLIEFDTSGDDLNIEIILNKSPDGVSPEFNKLNLLYK